MSGYSGRGNKKGRERARGSNSNSYPLNMDVIFNPKKNNTMNEFRSMVESNKKAGNNWKKAHENARLVKFPIAKPTFASQNYPKATFKYKTNRYNFEEKSTNKTNKKKKRKTMKKRSVKINNPIIKMNEITMGGGRRRKTRRKKRRKKRRKTRRKKRKRRQR